MKPTTRHNLERRLEALESRPGAQEPLTIRLNEVDHDGNVVTTEWESARHINPRDGLEYFLELPVGEGRLANK
ncbi:hypothetical protein EON83_27735 [bacterium]|nr:MAG: hypothetical protein EON83_27735 [bacterium]